MSKCLLGENVRYDGGNCLIREDLVTQLETHFEIISICPEVMAGMDIPREPIEFLNGKIINQNGEDLTDSFTNVLRYLDTLIKNSFIDMALMKEDSPSCGVHNIYDGSFSGAKVAGEGLISGYLKSRGIKVYSEAEVEQLISDYSYS